jgi:hypothetical protein
MSKHITISSLEAADRLAIRELVEAYAHCADTQEWPGRGYSIRNRSWHVFNLTRARSQAGTANPTRKTRGEASFCFPSIPTARRLASSFARLTLVAEAIG